MKYDYKCEKCGATHEVKMIASEFQEIKEEARKCLECGGDAFYDFNPGSIEVSYKGFQWADKNYKEKRYRKKRSNYLKTRQKEVNPTWELQPNYNGERTHNWREAREMAKQDGKIHESFDPLVDEEGSEDRMQFAVEEAPTTKAED